MTFKTTSRQSDEFWSQIRKPFSIAVIASFLLLQLLFLANLSYLYGTQFQDSERYHKLNILLVDYDGGVIGQSVQEAYSVLKRNSFPTLKDHPTSQFPSDKDIFHAVCRGDYWGAVYTTPNASTRLSTALSSDNSSYNPQDALVYVWNGARYPALSQSAIYASLQTLIASANSITGSNLTQSLDSFSPTTMHTLLNPVSGTEINIKPTSQGTRVLYNTVSMIMPIIQQFFFLMALNGISTSFQLYTKLPPKFNGAIRLVLSVSYTLIASLCMAGYIWAFRESWAVNWNQFVLTWLVCWLYMHINFCIMDVATTWIPMQFMSFFVLSWAITNVASTISPFELNPGFYSWGYALPAHEVYQVLVEIWSDGCENQSKRALPILFAWWAGTLALAILSLQHRCEMAIKAEKATGAGGQCSEESGDQVVGTMETLSAPSRSEFDERSMISQTTQSLSSQKPIAGDLEVTDTRESVRRKSHDTNLRN